MTSGSYGVLARYYDALMAHVPYDRWIAGLHTLFAGWTRPVRSVLDLGCGTGTVACGLCAHGYDVVATDASEDMLAAARQKETPARLLYLQQDMTKLDLYGTVDAACCTLDGLNYLTSPSALTAALRRVRLFLEPGGVFAFDLKTLASLRQLDGRAYVTDLPDVLCVWQTQKSGALCRHSVNLFEKQGALWNRHQEEHIQRVYTEAQVAACLAQAGFARWKTFGPYWSRASRSEEERLFWIAW